MKLVPISTIKEILQQDLSASRYRHSLNVAEWAAQLGTRYGWRKEEAYRAGLVHDCAKEWSPPKMLAYVKKYKLNIPDLTFIKKQAPNLCHGYVSAHVARSRKWIGGPRIVKAVASHTLGGLPMTLYDKIIFVADFSSKDRRFKQASVVRRLAWKDLDVGFLEAITLKIFDGYAHRRPLHPLSLQVRAAEVEKMGRR